MDEAATLDPIAYDRKRSELAKELGVRAKTLDDEVGKPRRSVKNPRNCFLLSRPHGKSLSTGLFFSMISLPS